MLEWFLTPTSTRLQAFDPAKYFNTSEELLARRFNRPRLHQLGLADQSDKSGHPSDSQANPRDRGSDVTIA